MTSKLTVSSPPENLTEAQVKDYTLIFESGLFDEKDYLTRYPDVKASKFTALEHYVRFGDKGGREPFIGYYPLYYRRYFPQLRHEGINSLVHYIQHGRALNVPTEPIRKASEQSQALMLYIDDYDEQYLLTEILLFIEFLLGRTLFDVQILLKSISEKTLPLHQRLTCYCLGDQIDTDCQLLKQFWPAETHSMILFSSSALDAIHQANLFDFVPAVDMIICSDKNNSHLIGEQRTTKGHHYQITDRRYQPSSIQDNLEFYHQAIDRPQQRWQLFEKMSSLFPFDLSIIYLIDSSVDSGRLIKSINSVLGQRLLTIEIIFVFSEAANNQKNALNNYYSAMPAHICFYSESWVNEVEILEAIEISHGKAICFSKGDEVYEESYFWQLVSAMSDTLVCLAHGDSGLKSLSHIDETPIKIDGCLLPSGFSEELFERLFVGGLLINAKKIKSYFSKRQAFFSEGVAFLDTTLRQSTYLFDKSVSFSRDDTHLPACSEALDVFFEALDEHESDYFSGLNIGLYAHGLLFSKGGIEYLAVHLANQLVLRGHRVTLYCRAMKHKKPLYPCLESIDIIDCWNMKDFDQSKVDLQKALINKKTDVFIPMLSEYLFTPIIDAAFEVGVPTIASEHNDPDIIVKQWWDKYDRISSFKKADHIHLLLNKFKQSLPEELEHKVSVIPNFIPENALPQVMPKKKKDIIFVGRLAEQKGIERLIEAFYRLADCNSDWTLSIFGEGTLRDELQTLISQRRLTDKVMLKGVSNNIFEEYLNASIFVLPSYFEGFGIVVIEAQQAGLPCVAFQSCNGPNDLISDGVNGFLVDDSQPDLAITGLADKLRLLMSNESLRIEMGDKGRLHSQAYFQSSIIDQWESLIKAVHRKGIR